MIVSRLGPDQIRIKTPAKINLFLEVLGLRPDGYHNINSLFQAISIFDELEFEMTQKKDISLDIVGCDSLDNGNSNLVCRTYSLMQKEFGLTTAPAIRLEKQIPVAAGLGGGSADAAATIMACNILYELGLSSKDMAELGVRIGSDVPFFFCHGQALVSGRGEIVEESTFPTGYELVLITPNVQVSTAEAYAGIEIDLTKSRSPFILRRCETVNEFIERLAVSGNDFEITSCDMFPQFGSIRRILLSMGAVLVRMSGSGPTFFGIFDRIPGGSEHKTTNRGDWRCFRARPLTLPAG